MLLGVVNTYKQTPVNFPLFLAGKVLLENRSAPHCPYKHSIPRVWITSDVLQYVFATSFMMETNSKPNR